MARRPAAVADTANSRRHSSMVLRHSGRAARNGTKRAAGIVRTVAPRSHSFSSSALAVAVVHTSRKKVCTISCAMEKFCRSAGFAGVDGDLVSAVTGHQQAGAAGRRGGSGLRWISRTPCQEASTRRGMGPGLERAVIHELLGEAEDQLLGVGLAMACAQGGDGVGVVHPSGVLVLGL